MYKNVFVWISLYLCYLLACVTSRFHGRQEFEIQCVCVLFVHFNGCMYEHVWVLIENS